MATFDDNIYTKLSTTSSITDLVSTRTYPQVLPQKSSYPAISFTLIGNQLPLVLSADSKVRQPRYQFNCFALTAKGAGQLAEALLTLLQGYTGDWGGQTIGYCRVLNQNDFYSEAAEAYWTALDARFFYTVS